MNLQRKVIENFYLCHTLYRELNSSKSSVIITTFARNLIKHTKSESHANTYASSLTEATQRLRKTHETPYTPPTNTLIRFHCYEHTPQASLSRHSTNDPLNGAIGVSR